VSRKRKGKKRGASAALGVDEALHSALKALQSGRLDKAERIYRKILKRCPDQPDALHFLGLIEGQRGKPDEAIRLMRQAIEVLPINAVYHHNLGTLMKDQGRWGEAIRCYRKAVELDPDYVDAHYNMGEALLNHGNLRHGTESGLCGSVHQHGQCVSRSGRAGRGHCFIQKGASVRTILP
jgi:tetratricopeptide (TPR) repeat protein